MSETSLHISEILMQTTTREEDNSLNLDTSIPDLFGRSSRSQQSHTSPAQALRELEEIRLVVHRQESFDPGRKRVSVILSGSGSPIGVDIVFSRSKDQNLRRVVMVDSGVRYKTT